MKTQTPLEWIPATDETNGLISPAGGTSSWWTGHIIGDKDETQNIVGPLIVRAVNCHEELVGALKEITKCADFFTDNHASCAERGDGFNELVEAIYAARAILSRALPPDKTE